MLDPPVGVVIIGRNEGLRLERCLKSVIGRVSASVYVDSGSTDDSLAIACRLGLDIIELDSALPFTAARARNAGFWRLAEVAPQAALVQFLDGDCELVEGWLATGVGFLRAHPDVAVVSGRLRERFAAASPYNRLCDLEWDTPVGEAHASGGVALIRADAFASTGGFCEDLIAGEEADFGFRLRKAGWRIFRLQEEMALHDANMHHLRQWWQRAKRSGYADMEAYRRCSDDELRLRRKVWSNALWALPPAWPLWPLLWLRVYRKRGALYATHVVAGKLPHLHGQISFLMNRWQKKRPSLIEHK